MPFILRLSLFHRKLNSFGNRIPFFLTGFFWGGEAQTNNTVSGIAAYNHVPCLRHVDVFVPNTVNHLFSCSQSRSEVL